MSKQRTLELIKSLEPDDDERTGISKKITWILRHGAKAKKVNVSMDADGWVKVSDLLSCDILDDVTQETLMAVIVDSNQQKLRYKLQDGPGGTYIAAYSKAERKQTSSSAAVEERKVPAGTLRPEAQIFMPGSAVAPGGGVPPMGYPWPMGGYGFSPMMPQWPGAYPMAPPFGMDAGASGGRYHGRIKSFNEEKGFGFIECAETYAQFSRDVFLHKHQFGGMAVGTEVTFQVETNKAGMPQAKDLAPLGAGGAGAGKGRGKGKGEKGKGEKGKGEKGKEKGKGKGEKGKEKGKGKGGKGKKEKEKDKEKDKEEAGEGGKEAAADAPTEGAAKAEATAGEAAGEAKAAESAAAPPAADEAAKE